MKKIRNSIHDFLSSLWLALAIIVMCSDSYEAELDKHHQ